jgi:hypothetical protein
MRKFVVPITVEKNGGFVVHKVVVDASNKYEAGNAILSIFKDNVTVELNKIITLEEDRAYEAYYGYLENAKNLYGVKDYQDNFE